MAYFGALLYRLHVVLGLIGGLFFSLLGVTGAALAFRPGIERALYLPPVQSNAAPASWEQTTGSVLKQSSIPGRKIREVLLTDGRALEFVVHNRDGSDVASVYVDPSNGAVLSQRWHADSVFHKLRGLHTELLMGQQGRVIVSRLGLLLILQVMVGFAIWFLRGRPMYIHTSVGLGVGLLIALLAYSGFAVMTQRVASVTPVVTLRGVENKTSLDRIFEVALKRRPGMQLSKVKFPQAPSQPYEFWFTERPLETVVYMDPYGAVLPMMIRAEGNPMLEWHGGPAGGKVTRVLRFLAGIAILALFVTGALVAIRKRFRDRPA